MHKFVPSVCKAMDKKLTFLSGVRDKNGFFMDCMVLCSYSRRVIEWILV